MTSQIPLSLAQLMEIAEQESARRSQFFITVEHLFLALAQLENGLTARLFNATGGTLTYLVESVQDWLGRGDEKRYWAGFRMSPRANEVMDVANKLIDNGEEWPERALLTAIFEVEDSFVYRTIEENLDLGIAELKAELENWSEESVASPPMVRVDGADSFSPEQRRILQQMFRRYAVATVEKVFTEGFSGSMVLLARGTHPDGRSDAPTIVKLDDHNAIKAEKRRYDTFVKYTLPQRTARIESEPTLLDDLNIGGLQYTFVRPRNQETPTNFRDYALSHSPAEIVGLLRGGLYDGFRDGWWNQGTPYSFTLWQEYDLLLPPALVLDATVARPQNAATLLPLGDWMRDGELARGTVVGLSSFFVSKVRSEKNAMQLIAGMQPDAVKYAGRVEVYGLNGLDRQFTRGDEITKIYAKIRRTRDDLLLEYVEALAPDFDKRALMIPRLDEFSHQLPNPIRHYKTLMNKQINGRLSTIHGDLHTGNILIGSGGDAWLIDFEWTRDGHTLFDWAVLETSLLIDLLSVGISAEWKQIRSLMSVLSAALNAGNNIPLQGYEYTHADDAPTLETTFAAILELRRIVDELLRAGNTDLTAQIDRSEYFVALALCAMRVISWDARPLATRRVAFTASALAMETALHATLPQTGDLTLGTNPDQTSL